MTVSDQQNGLNTAQTYSPANANQPTSSSHLEPHQEHSEHSPLLGSQTNSVAQARTRARTPLPWRQLSVLFWIQLAEPLSAMVIYPFINKMVNDLPITGGDEARMGYYAGLIESLFSIAQALTVLYWSRLSDRIGRKPVILIGLGGLTLSLGLFGISTTFGALVFSRCLSGALNGNAGVMKSMMGEITDETNVAQAMALMPVIWNTGATVGPVIGGWLSNPHERFPLLFPGNFWATYPYALPCFTIALYCAGTWVVTFFYLEESMKLHHPIADSSEPGTGTLTPSSHHPSQLPLSQVLTPRVRIAIASYTFLAFLDIALRALQPLFLTASPSFGGLGFSVPLVGTCLAAFFIASGIYQALAFAPMYDWMGPKRIYIVSMWVFIPIYVLFPMMRASLGEGEVANIVTWVELALQIVLYIIMDMGFSSALIYIRGSAPNAYSLGVTNGLSQTAVSIARAIGPVSATSLFALSVQISMWVQSHWGKIWIQRVLGWFGANLVYILFVLVSTIGVVVAKKLPERPIVTDEADEVVV
ncbi:hypothetical protein GYMLUDRAFT_158193 [Collybiopsis luxurians FD-317 M1]|nr:hypothetical protein GYMLUDRAFT_158193 [Collybiopsis luxurians FD-317 M1]